MQRYFVKQMITDKSCIEIEEHYHHIVHVMRHKIGDKFYIVTPQSECFIVVIKSILSKSIQIEIVEKVEKDTELPIQITIAFSLPKGDKIEWIIQKATELGAYSFLPFESKFSVVKWDEKKSRKKIERLQAIASHASEQSHRVIVPSVLPLVTFKGLLDSCHKFDHVIVAYEEDAKRQEVSHFKNKVKSFKTQETVLMIFGSEGGLAIDEVEALKQKGAVSVGLGNRIMRAETAPLYALAATSYELELR